LQPEQFVRERVFREAFRVRVLGCQANAELITAIFQYRVDKKLVGQDVKIGSPEICFQGNKLDDPKYVLQRLWQPGYLAKNRSSWHTLSGADYTSYFLCHLSQHDAEKNAELMQRTFEYHPLWFACSFIPTCCMEKSALLASVILDPRWYNHPERPNRCSKLASYLGLTPTNFEAVEAGTVVGAKQERASLVADAWFGEYRGRDESDPANFLWRIYNHHGGDAKGLLAASRAFVQFARLVWLQRLTPTQRVFHPDVFFKHEAEAAAFREYLDSLKNQF